MQIKDITQYLETIAPLALQESYDNSGLIVGDRQTPVKGILISLDCTEEVVQEAIEKGCNLIVSHHPIVFSGLKKITGANYIERVVIKAIQNNIALYAIHTNLDNVLKSGVNGKIAEKLGLKNTRILSPKGEILCKLVTYCPTAQADALRQAIFEAGAGVIGNYDQCSFNSDGIGTFRGNDGADPFVGKVGELHKENEVRIETVFPAWAQNSVVAALLAAHPYEEVAYDVYALKNKHPQTGAGIIGSLSDEMDANVFLEHLKNTMKADGIRYTSYAKKIKTVAVCGGSGSFLLRDAMAQKADVLVTADFKYHQFFDAEGRIMIADIGHYESEQYTIELLGEILNKKFTTFAVLFTQVNTNPVNYYK
ncbi:MAG: Nif3-like dinuclear metal center hexameric protein [Bacteroidetes bacterium]|nr:MAG: Nif3-like dinuclear metal center hexameric protein [Bacteroidota bacterium]